MDVQAAATAVDVASLRVALVGYGEVGRIFAAALAKAGVRSICAYDVLIDDAAWSTQASARAAQDGVVLATSTRDAVRDADLVICAVTAANAALAANAIADGCRAGAFVLDVNSASPQTKSDCARAIAPTGGRYVEAAVMSSVPPYGLRVPMLLGGPHADAAHPTLVALGFDAPVGSQVYGVVSAVKLCRSVFIKGLEAIAVEGLLAARHYGVEQEVLASLAETFPSIDWERQASYFWQRVVQHGRRRAEEMREAAVTVAGAGLTPRMASGAAEVQAWVASLKAADTFAGIPASPGWRELADAARRTLDVRPPASD